MRTVTRQVLDQCTADDRVSKADAADGPLVQSILARRARLLPPPDARLMELSLAGYTVRELARLMGRHPGCISRRLAALKRRLCGEVVAALADCPADLPDHYLRIGIAHYVHGRSPRTMARQFALSQGEIARIIGFLRAWAMLRRAG